MLTLRPAAFTLALVGVYGAGLVAPRLWRLDFAALRLRPPAIGAALGLALTALVPLRPRAGDAGYLWQVARHTPIVLNRPLVFWALVPLGTAILASRWTRPDRVPSLAIAFTVCFLLSTVVVRLAYQKYFDPFALLAVVLTLRADDLRRPSDAAGLGALGVLSLLYAASLR